MDSSLSLPFAPSPTLCCPALLPPPSPRPHPRPLPQPLPLSFRPTSIRASAAVKTLEKASAIVKTLKKALADAALVEKSVNTICFLAVDAVEKANSGLPGLPMGCAPIGHVLFDEAMSYNPKNPLWIC